MITQQPILIDADTGIDDSLAILHALKAPDVRVVGITTVFGNSSVEQAADNTLRIVKLAASGYAVPVARGAAKPMLREWEGPVPIVHGGNGIGDVELPPSEQTVEEEPAAPFIVRMAKAYEGELTLVTLGRMTNIAEALALDPGLPKRLKKVVVMGGTAFAPGNVKPRSEANFHGDPEAAAQVIASGMPLTLVGLDVTMKARLSSLDLEELERGCRPENRAIASYLRQAFRHYFSFYRDVNGFFGVCPLHDPLTMVVARRPSVVHTRILRVQIECEGSLNLGAVVPDLRMRPVGGTDISVCVEVDADHALRELLSVF